MLIQCPECHHEVSDQAESCLSCGHPLRRVSDSAVGAAKKGYSPPKKATAASLTTLQAVPLKMYFFLYLRYVLALIILVGIIGILDVISRLSESFKTWRHGDMISVGMSFLLVFIWMVVTKHKFIGFAFFFAPIIIIGSLGGLLFPMPDALMFIYVMVIMLIITPPIADKYFAYKKEPNKELDLDDEEQADNGNDPEPNRRSPTSS